MWKLAWRNLWRQKVRTFITGSAIAYTLMLMLFSAGVQGSMHGKYLDAAANSAGGGVIVHGEGYWRSPAGDRLVRDAGPVVASAAAVPGVEEAVPRVLVQGLLSSTRGNAGALLKGIDAPRERALQDPARFLVDGEFLDAPVDPDAPKGHPLVLGKTLAEDLKVGRGDKVVVTTTDPDGEMVRALFRVRGLLDSGSQALDRGMAYTTVEAAQEAFGLGDAVTQVGLVLGPKASPVAVQAALREALSARLRPVGSDPDTASPTDLEVLTWREAMPEMIAFIEVDRRMDHVTWTVVFLIVAFGIMNTFLMAVMERIRELGLLSALGLSPGRVARLVLAETTLLALVFGTLGTLGALALHHAVAANGIDFGAMAGGDMDISGVVLEDMMVYSVIDPARWSVSIGLVLLVVVLSGLYPAWRSTRLDPTQAMRTYE